jgi:hypothetical protein
LMGDRGESLQASSSDLSLFGTASKPRASLVGNEPDLRDVASAGERCGLEAVRLSTEDIE